MKSLTILVLASGLLAWWLATDETRLDADDLVAERLAPAPGSSIWRTPSGPHAAMFGVQACLGTSLAAYGWARARARKDQA